MIRLPIVILIISGSLLCAGCSTLKTLFGPEPPPPIKENPSPLPTIPIPTPPVIKSETQAAQLERARELLLTGDDGAAQELFKKIASAKGVPGVTDEALFRQGLLTLKFETETGGYPQTRQLLERLIRDYPGSIWAVQALPLNDLLVEYWTSELSHGKIRRQVKALKESNVSLARENKEMRLNIEELKSLEREMEQKSRR